MTFTDKGLTVSVAEYHALYARGLAHRDLDGNYYVVFQGRVVRATINGEK